MPVPPMGPLPPGWEPSPEKMQALTGEFGHLVDIALSLRRFRNHYAEGQTSRAWEARFENWVLADYQRVEERSGTDDFGNPRNRRKTSVVQPAKPGDPDYVDLTTDVP